MQPAAGRRVRERCPQKWPTSRLFAEFDDVLQGLWEKM
jgi:hypothetical protein